MINLQESLRTGLVDRYQRPTQSAAERPWAMLLLRVDPAFDGLHTDPRFERLVKRVGLP